MIEFKPWPEYFLPVTWDEANNEWQEVVLVLHPDGHVRWKNRVRADIPAPR